MPKQFELSGPAFVGLVVRDVAAAADFYGKKLGFRRDPENFKTAKYNERSSDVPR